jgi:hypothetical protein
MPKDRIKQTARNDAERIRAEGQCFSQNVFFNRIILISLS